MGWQDRGYNAGHNEAQAYFSNPLGLVQFALTIWRSRTLHISLSFWLLFAALMSTAADIRAGMPQYIPIDLGVLLGVCLFHELGHRIFARWVGGTHWEWVLWPLGGLVAPTTPRTPKAVFVANMGGIIFNLLLIVAFVATVFFARGTFLLGAASNLPLGLGIVIEGWGRILLYILAQAFVISVEMLLINLFPCYWFDGGHIWQSILWPFFGQTKAGRITCMAGMILAVPLFLFSLFGGSIFGVIMWGMVFYDCLRRRQMLAALGEGMEDDEGSSYNYMDTPEPHAPKKRKKRWFNTARKRAIQDQAEQAKIDAILAKVKERGLHSLSWWEKRTLKKATERQRQHDVASRL